MIAADRVERIQEALREDGLAGWLLFDFHGSNPIARSVLGLAGAPNAAKTTRRWFYFVPARGAPRKLVHRIEPRVLDHLPGESAVYLTWEELDRELAALVRRAVSGHAAEGGFAPAIAMEYSPEARLPYVSKVDAGTVELVRAAGAQVVTSADLAQRFDGVLDPEARRDHVRTGVLLDGIIRAALERARDAARTSPGSLTEMGLQRFLLERFDAEGLVSSDPPTVAVNAHSGDPHFTTAADTDAPIRPGDFLLIDAWAKKKTPGSVYADYTQVASVSAAAPETSAPCSRSCATRGTRRSIACANRSPPRGRSADATWTTRRAKSSARADTATASFTAWGIRSARKCTRTASTWTTWKRGTSADFSRGRSFPSSRASTWKTSAFGAK